MTNETQTICHRLNGIEYQLKRIADALDAQTPAPPPKLYARSRNTNRGEVDEHHKTVHADDQNVDRLRR